MVKKDLVPHTVFAPPGLSPAAKKYVDDINTYINSQVASGYVPTSTGIPATTGRGVVDVANLEKLASAGRPVADLFAPSLLFMGNDSNFAGKVTANPDTQVRLVDNTTKQVVQSGIGVAGLKDVYDQSTALSKAQGDTANWDVQTLNPTTGTWETKAADNPPAHSIMGDLFPIVMTTLGAVMGGPLGAAAASGLVTAGNGGSVTDILKSATLAGIGTYAGGELFNGLGGGAGSAASGAASSGAGVTSAGIGSTAGAAAGSGAGSVAGSLAGDIIVNGVRAGIGSTIGAGLGAGVGSGLGSVILGGANPGDITVIGTPHPPITIPTTAVAGGIGGLTLGGVNAGTGGTPPADDGDITVVGTPRPPISIPATAVAGGIGGGLGSVVPPSDPGGDITVDGRPEQPAPPYAPLITGAATLPLLTTVPPFTVQTPPVTAPNGGILGTGVTATEIPGLIQGVTGVVGGIGGLIGGGGGDGDGGPINGGGTLDIPAAINAAKRTAIAPTYDPFTYGQAGGDQPKEFAFYQGYAEGGDVDDHTRHAAAFASGIGHRGPGPIHGVGSGQSDEIPAWVANDEYIWSAQDVADLGDGSSTEGHRRLDRMREMVRRRAGRKDVKNIAKPQRGLGELLTAVGA